MAEEYEIKEKAQTIGQIKRIADVQGKAATSTEIASAINSISQTVVQRVNQMSLETTKSFLPITSQLRQVQDLLQSNKTDDQDRAFELIDRMQERLGLDLSKYSKNIGDAVKKLYDMNSQRKQDQQQAKQIHTEKIEELKQEREILRERGINTYVNEENYRLELKTKQQEKQERIEIIQKEKELQQREKDLKFEAKQIQSAESIDLDRQERFLADQENLTKDQLELQDRKEAAGMKPDERAQGYLSQTFGAAFGEIKNFGMELKQIGKSVKDTFGAIPDLIGNFAKGIGTLITRFKTIALAMLPAIFGFLVLAAPFIAIGVAIGVLLYNLKAIINWFRESALGKLLGLDKNSKKREEEDKQKGTGKYQSLDEGTYDVMGGMDGQNNEGPTPSEKIENQTLARNKFKQDEAYTVSPFTDEAERNIILPDSRVKTPAEKRADMRARGEIPRGDLGPLSDAPGKTSTNNVIAPSNNVITTNTTNQSMGLMTNNFDPTFLNLNKVSV